jgi:hypothetical protein
VALTDNSEAKASLERRPRYMMRWGMISYFGPYLTFPFGSTILQICATLFELRMIYEETRRHLCMTEQEHVELRSRSNWKHKMSLLFVTVLLVLEVLTLVGTHQQKGRLVEPAWLFVLKLPYTQQLPPYANPISQRVEQLLELGGRAEAPHVIHLCIWSLSSPKIESRAGFLVRHQSPTQHMQRVNICHLSLSFSLDLSSSPSCHSPIVSAPFPFEVFLSHVSHLLLFSSLSLLSPRRVSGLQIHNSPFSWHFDAPRNMMEHLRTIVVVFANKPWVWVGWFSSVQRLVDEIRLFWC